MESGLARFHPAFTLVLVKGIVLFDGGALPAIGTSEGPFSDHRDREHAVFVIACNWSV